MPYPDLLRWWRTWLSLAGLLVAGALLVLPSPPQGLGGAGAGSTVMRVAIVLVVLWVPLFSWTQLVRDDRIGIIVGLVLFGGLTGTIAVIRWPPVDPTVPLTLDAGLGYFLATSATTVVALRVDRRRLAPHQEWAYPRGDRGLGWALLVLSTVVSVTCVCCSATLLADGPLEPGRSELLPLPANLVAVGEEVADGNGWSERSFRIAARDDASRAEVSRRLVRHLQQNKGWHLDTDPPHETCRSLRLLLTIPVGEICVELSESADGTVTVYFSTSAPYRF